MATTNGNRQILDLKRWEKVTDAPTATVAGAFIASSRHYRQQQLYVTSATTAWLYNPYEDGWVAVPSPALGGTFGVGACGVGGAISTGATVGASALAAIGGTTSTIVTDQLFNRDMRGYSVHIAEGPNAGITTMILSNTMGASSVITVDPQASAFTTATRFRLLTPVFYVITAGAINVANTFRKYDVACNTWTTLSSAGLPTTLGTDARLLTTPSWIDDGYTTFASGTATAGTATTLVDNTKTWAVSGWINFQVRIVSGTGAGQVETILANSATALTTTNFSISPDSTSQYSIEGNDEYIYLMGNNAVTMYRYSIYSNVWTTITPASARGGAPGLGMSGHWIWGCTEPEWTNPVSGFNGRFIYSFRGAAGAVLDRYDISLNRWNTVIYSPATEVFGGGTKWAYNKDSLYMHKDATGRWFKYDIPRAVMNGWTTQIFPGGAALGGDTAFDITYHDGPTDIDYVYYVLNTSAVMLRQMVI